MYRLWLLLVIPLLFLTGCSKHRIESTFYSGEMSNESIFAAITDKQDSLERRDYAIKLDIEVVDEKQFKVTFVIADLSKYTTDSGGELGTKENEVTAEGISAAMDKYFETNEKRVDLGHLEEINMAGEKDRLNLLFLELGRMPEISKSVKVSFQDDDRKILLRNLIKTAFSGEEF